MRPETGRASATPGTHLVQAPHTAVAVVLKGYPRLSETFIAQEILALERRGLSMQLFSLRHPTDPATHPIHRRDHRPGELSAGVPEGRAGRGYGRPGAARVAWPATRRPRRAFLKDLRRDPTANRCRRFGQACVLATELPAAVTRDLCPFPAHAGSVARYAAKMRGLPWSASAHAKDIWTTPDWELREKLADLDWLVTCTAHGCTHLRSLAEAPEKVTLVYHGLDFARFPLAPKVEVSDRNGRSPREPVRLLSVGRAVEKKGYDVLLEALGRLPRDLAWHLTHIGGGLEAQSLRDAAAKMGLSGHVTWMGAQPHDVVLQAYRDADLFVLASKVGRDGDRDGLPNVLMEAQSQELCCLATRVSAIPELIEEDATGSLVAPEDPAELAAALERLILDPALRTRLGEAGSLRVRRDFSLDAGIEALARRLGGVETPLAAQ